MAKQLPQGWKYVEQDQLPKGWKYVDPKKSLQKNGVEGQNENISIDPFAGLARSENKPLPFQLSPFEQGVSEGFKSLARAANLMKMATPEEQEKTRQLFKKHSILANLGMSAGVGFPLALSELFFPEATPQTVRMAARVLGGGLLAGASAKGEGAKPKEISQAQDLAMTLAGLGEFKPSEITPFGDNDMSVLQYQKAKENEKLFQQYGIEFDRADITQDFTDQSYEQAELGNFENKSSKDLRELKKRQASQIAANIEPETVSDKELTGAAIKDNLFSLDKAYKKKVDEEFENARRLAEKHGDVALDKTMILDSLQKQAKRKGFKNIEAMLDNFEASDNTGGVKGIRSTLKRYGILDKRKNKVEVNVKDKSNRGQIRIVKLKKTSDGKPLSLSNYNEFKKALNSYYTSSGEARAILPGIKTAAKQTFEETLKNPETTKQLHPDMKSSLDNADKLYQESKRVFAEASLNHKLIKLKDFNKTNDVEPSKVVDTLFGTNTPVEQIRKTISTLENSGQKSTIADLQSELLKHIGNQALKDSTNSLDNVTLIKPSNFRNTIDKIGIPKLKAIFKSNPKKLNTILDMYKIAKLIQRDREAILKGSARANISLERNFSRKVAIMFGAALGKEEGGAITSVFGALGGKIVGDLLKKRGDKQAVTKILNTSLKNPAQKSALADLKLRFPYIAAYLGILNK